MATVEIVDLDALRSEIDQCDAVLTDVLLRRLAASVRIAEYKKEHGLSLYQPAREVTVLNKIGESLRNSPYAQEIQNFYRHIFRLSRCVQLQSVFPHNFALIGFMGSGKTTVGKYLAEVSGYTYYDVDIIIEQETQKSIPEIFSQHGEPFFRDLEQRVIARVSNSKHAVISCGGGCVLNPANIIRLKQTGKLFWLAAEPETVYDRIKDQGSRPLSVNKTFEDIKSMMQKRQSLYKEAADYRIAVDHKTVGKVVDDILGIIMEL